MSGSTNSPPNVSRVEDARIAHRLRRLREELIDDSVPLDLDGPDGVALLEEVDYALHPPSHEGTSPRFGALIAGATNPQTDRYAFPAIVEHTAVDIATVRRLADGRTSFIARSRRGHALVSFDRTIEHEATAVQVAATASITVVQRRENGWVRIFAPSTVVTWDGARWWSKPMASHLAAAIADATSPLESAVLTGIAEFCVHWMSAGHIGGILVWLTDEAAHRDHFGFGAEVRIPPLHIANRQHFAALLNVLAQTDRAAIVEPDGRVDTVGVALRTSEAAARAIPAFRGTRHTSALRYSYDTPSALVFVVSSAGPVSVLREGRLITAAAPTAPEDSDGDSSER